MKRNIAASLLCLWLFSAAGVASAAPLILNLSTVIDKPSYNSNYSVGVQAWVEGSGVDVATVTVSHQPIQGGTLPTWSLSAQSPSSWWSWAPYAPNYSSGPLDGCLTVTATSINGESVSTSDYCFQPQEELAAPSIAITAVGGGYQVIADGVSNADSYYMRLWDWIDYRYVNSQESTVASAFTSIPSDGLVDGRTYSLYFGANNYFDGGEADNFARSVYRSMSLTYLTYEASAVSEPGSLFLLAIGLGFLWLIKCPPLYAGSLAAVSSNK